MDIPFALEVSNVSKSFSNQGKVEQILTDVTFSVRRGEFLSILGHSGCGKSTLLNIIGGFEKADRGQVLFEGQSVQEPHRQCVMLFQNYGLLPWRNVLKNVELGLENTIREKHIRQEQALHYIQLVGLKDKASHFPHQLSGGMQQRVAIARALAVKPDLILMDEPFAALDTFNRYYLQDELLLLQKQEETTIILVTHDIDEAVYLSDRILMMESSSGTIQRELKIENPRPRDRSHSDFQYYRTLIFDAFHFSHPSRRVEYYI